MKGYNFRAPCLLCGELTRGGNKCEKHKPQPNPEREAARALRKRLTGQYSGDYKRRAKAVRNSAVVCHICKEGYRPLDPWQADHLIPGDPRSPLLPAHRSCNAARGDKPLEN